VKILIVRSQLFRARVRGRLRARADSVLATL